MTIPGLHYTIDDGPTQTNGFSGSSVAFGGFSQGRGVLTEATARRIPSTVTQGSSVTAFTDANGIVWEGRLSAPPAIRGGLASFAAQGESVRAVKRATRLLYQNRDYSAWTDYTGSPHASNDRVPQKLPFRVENGQLVWFQESGTDIAPGESMGAAFWAPGSTISRLAFNWRSGFGGDDWQLEFYTANGPGIGSATLVQGVGLAGSSGSFDATASAAADEAIIQIRWIGALTAMGIAYTVVRDLRVNGIAPGDEFRGDQVVTDVGGRLGYDTTGIASTGLNVLPLDWTSGSWAELLSYIATLEDRYWGVYEDGKLLYPAWGDREWTCYQADGATVDLTPLELYNQVTVKYVDVGGAPREITVTADPDPLAATGIVNVWEESLADVQPDSTLATAVANNLLPRVSTLREQGRIDAVKLYDSVTGREATYEARAGDTVRVADRDMNTASVHRIFEAEYTPNGVALGIESGVSIASLLGRAGLVAARAPSTAQLPELPPPGPPEMHPERVQREAEIAAAGSVARWQWLQKKR